MALWGNKDLKAANGASDTVTVTASGLCTFSANVNASSVVDVGDWINVTDGGVGIIETVTNNTVVTVHSQTPLTNVSAKAWYTYTAPKHIGSSATESATTIFGVDTTEQAVAVADIAGAEDANNAPHHAGWVRRVDKGTGRKPRDRYETLVAMSSISGDAEDADFVDS